LRGSHEIEGTPGFSDNQSADLESSPTENLFLFDEKYVWFLPPTLSIGSFYSYSGTSTAFRDCIDVLSGYQWAAADGGKYMAEIVRPVLNGPVTLSISILFGTLVAMTIQTLYRRQVDIRQNLIGFVEETRELQLLVEGFPEPYLSRGKKLLEEFMTESIQDARTGNITPKTLRKQQIGSFLLMLNDLSNDTVNKGNPLIVGEAYGSVHRLKDLRTNLISTLRTKFSFAHYANIGVLAITILFVFLLETNQSAMQFLLGFQLSICWALLIGSYALLAVIIYDLFSPFTGIFNTIAISSDESEMENVRDYILASNRTEH
jgi:hypothetical protein